MRILALQVKGVGVAGYTLEDLCDNPCRTRLVCLELEWKPLEIDGVKRYSGMLAIEPLANIASTPSVIVESTIYKLEYEVVWERGAATLASHVMLCNANLVYTPEGPWIDAYNKLLGEFAGVTTIEVPGAYCGDPLHNPFFHEGASTLYYEVYEKHGHPDAVIAPGYPALLKSLHTAFERLADIGLLDEAPRVYAVDIGLGIPRWLADALELIEIRVAGRRVEEAKERLERLGFRVTRDSVLVEAAREKLLSLGEVSKDERVLMIML